MFGLGTLATLLRSPRLRGGTLALVDLDADGLALVEALARRPSHEWDAGLSITSSTRRAEVRIRASALPEWFQFWATQPLRLTRNGGYDILDAIGEIQRG